MATDTQSQNGAVVRGLIGHIRSERLAVGDRLPSMRQLAVKLDVRLGAVRDAMMQAETMGLVKIRPRAGAFVQSLNYAPLVGALSDTLEASLMQVDHNLFHLLEARRLVEVEVAAAAAKRRRLEDLLPLRESLDEMFVAAGNEVGQNDPAERGADFVEADVRFHLEIAKIAGNPVLVTTLQALLGLLRPHLSRLPWTPQRRLETDRSHGEIYDALMEGNEEKARTSMRRHLEMAYESLLKRIRSTPQPLPDSTQDESESENDTKSD